MKKWGFPFGWTKESEVNRFDGEQLFLWKQPETSFLGTDPSATDPPDIAPVILMNAEAIDMTFQETWRRYSSRAAGKGPRARAKIPREYAIARP